MRKRIFDNAEVYKLGAMSNALESERDALRAELAAARAELAELKASRAELMATLAAYGNAEPPNGSEYEQHAIEQVLSIGSIKAEHPRLYAQAVAELAALQAMSTESRTLRPVACNRQCFQRGWKAAQDEAASLAHRNVKNNGNRYDESDGAYLASVDTECAIRTLRPPANCDGCNPLEPMIDDEKAFGRGAWVYCNQHRKPHQTGWCTVSVRDKIGLGVDSAHDAYEKCKDFDLIIF